MNLHNIICLKFTKLLKRNCQEMWESSAKHLSTKPTIVIAGSFFGINISEIVNYLSLSLSCNYSHVQSTRYQAVVKNVLVLHMVLFPGVFCDFPVIWNSRVFPLFQDFSDGWTTWFKNIQRNFSGRDHWKTLKWNSRKIYGKI